METPATRNALVGAPVLLLVAEPWDFLSSHGRGRLQGHISDFRHFGPDGGQELFIAVSTLLVDGQAVDSLRATPLHPSGGDLLQSLLERRSAAVRVFGPLGSAVRLVAAIRRLGPGRPGAGP